MRPEGAPRNSAEAIICVNVDTLQRCRCHCWSFGRLPSFYKCQMAVIPVRSLHFVALDSGIHLHVTPIPDGPRCRFAHGIGGGTATRPRVDGVEPDGPRCPFDKLRAPGRQKGRSVHRGDREDRPSYRCEPLARQRYPSPPEPDGPRCRFAHRGDRRVASRTVSAGVRPPGRGLTDDNIS